MKLKLSSFVVGFIFALGLGISGMTRPEKVVGFLDLFGNWDPSLVFVMVGAIIVHFLFYRFIRLKPSPLFSPQWHVPTKKEITPALGAGAFLFGVGWAIAGYCPGPAFASLASFDIRPFIFVLSMVLGMYLFKLLDKKLKIKR